MKLLKLLSIVAFAFALSACAQLQKLTGYKTYDVHFASGSSAISGAGGDVIAAAAKRAKKGDVYNVRLVGYTDATGNSEANQALSERRVQAVKNALVRRGIKADNISASAYGERFSMEDNNSEDRKVEIRVRAANRNNWATRHEMHHSKYF